MLAASTCHIGQVADVSDVGRCQAPQRGPRRRFTDDFPAAAKQLEAAGVTPCDEIEPLPEGFRGGWFSSPASIVHMVREPDAW